MEKWGKDTTELLSIVYQGLPSYEAIEGEFCRMDADDLKDTAPYRMSEALFKPSDVEAFEHENEWLFNDSSKSSLSPEEARELGRLRREKDKWDSSVEAAVTMALFCRDLGHPITKAQLQDEIYKIDSDLPMSTIEMIWKALPEDLKQGAGRPRKKE
jgi:hypothetical protein